MTSIPTWQPGDAEAIRRALCIRVLPQALQAISNAMAALQQTYPGAIPSAQAELAAIDAIDAIDAGAFLPPLADRDGFRAPPVLHLPPAGSVAPVDQPS